MHKVWYFKLKFLSFHVPFKKILKEMTFHSSIYRKHFSIDTIFPRTKKTNLPSSIRFQKQIRPENNIKKSIKKGETSSSTVRDFCRCVYYWACFDTLSQSILCFVSIRPFLFAVFVTVISRNILRGCLDIFSISQWPVDAINVQSLYRNRDI